MGTNLYIELSICMANVRASGPVEILIEQGPAVLPPIYIIAFSEALVGTNFYIELVSCSGNVWAKILYRAGQCSGNVWASGPEPLRLVLTSQGFMVT